MGCPGSLIQLAGSQGLLGIPQCTTPQSGRGRGVWERDEETGGMAEGTDKKGRGREGKETPEEERRDGGAEAAVPKRRSKRSRGWNGTSGRRKEGRSSEVMEIMYGGLVS